MYYKETDDTWQQIDEKTHDNNWYVKLQTGMISLVTEVGAEFDDAGKMVVEQSNGALERVANVMLVEGRSIIRLIENIADARHPTANAIDLHWLDEWAGTNEKWGLGNWVGQDELRYLGV
jgi:hypothetical protein